MNGADRIRPFELILTILVDLWMELFRTRTGPINWRRNIYVALVFRFTLLMVLYSICRVGFFLFNVDFFPNMSVERLSLIMAGGLRFDLAALLYLNSLFILLTLIPLKVRFHSSYQAFLKYLFFITNGVGLATNIIDFIYYRFTLRRTTLSVLGQFENEQNWISLIFWFFIDYWYAVLFFMGLIFIMVFIYKKIKVEGPQVRHPLTFYISGTCMMLLIAYLAVGGMRGGFRHSTRPITLSNAAEYAETPKDINIVLNTPFALMRTASTSVIEKVNYFDSEEKLSEIYSPLHFPSDSSVFRPENVMVIILESFSKEFIGSYNADLENGAYKGYAPFIDSLISVSRAYQYSFANGRKSIDAMPSVICSIPSIEVPYVLSHYSGNKVNSLAGLLKEKGYYSAFLHGAPNGSMGFQAFANLCGFDDYFGMTEYGNDEDFDDIWGIWDDKFLQFTLKKINSFREPFYVNFFSVSSHHPYQLPDEYKGKFEGGPLPIHKTIQYTDSSLKKFFEQASKMSWFNNTLFVITADHASGEIYYPEYNSAWGYFSIPLFFFKPGSDWSELKNEIVQQIDIMPTVLNYLGYDKPYIAFGRDAFEDSSVPFAFNYLNNTYQSFVGDYLLFFDGTKSVALYNYKVDKSLSNNMVDQKPEVVYKMEINLKAFIQQYNNRIVDDNLTTEGPQKDLIQGHPK